MDSNLPPVLDAAASKANMAQVKANVAAPVGRAQTQIPSGPGLSLPTEGRYKKKPVVIQAFRLVNNQNPPQWFSQQMNSGNIVYVQDQDPTSNKILQTVQIKTLEGTMTASDGDWIIIGVNGEIYPCKNDVFEKSYDWISQ